MNERCERVRGPGRESLLLCTRSFLPRSSVRHAVFLLPSVKKTPSRRRRRHGPTRRTIADDERKNDDESGTGRLTPVVASPGDLSACFGRVSSRRSRLEVYPMLSATILAVIKRTPYLIISLIG